MKPSTRSLVPLESLDPDFGVVNRSLRVDQKGIRKSATGLGFDLTDLAVETLISNVGR